MNNGHRESAKNGLGSSVDFILLARIGVIGGAVSHFQDHLEAEWDGDHKHGVEESLVRAFDQRDRDHGHCGIDYGVKGDERVAAVETGSNSTRHSLMQEMQSALTRPREA